MKFGIKKLSLKQLFKINTEKESADVGQTFSQIIEDGAEIKDDDYERRPSVLLGTILVGNGSERMQFDIKRARVGDKIEVEPDDEDRYLVSTHDLLDLGYLSKRMAEKIDSLIDYEIIDGEIVEIIEDSGKLNVKVNLVLEDAMYMYKHKGGIT